MTHFLEPNRIPIFQIGDCLLLTIQVDLEDRMIMTLKDDLAERIGGAGVHVARLRTHDAGT